MPKVEMDDLPLTRLCGIVIKNLLLMKKDLAIPFLGNDEPIMFTAAKPLDPSLSLG